MRSVTTGATFTGGAGGGSGAFGGATGSGVLMIREIGGRKERVVFAVPSARFGRGFFSSMSETDSTGAFIGAEGVTFFSAAAAAATAAARERAAGVGAIAMLRGALAPGLTGAGGVFALLAGSAATGDFADLPGDGDLRDEVLVVVLVGMFF